MAARDGGHGGPQGGGPGGGGGFGAGDVTPSGATVPEGTIFVDVPGLEASGADFNAVAAHARSIQQRFVSDTESIGDCWGGDDTGKAFFQTYGQPYQDAVQAGADIGDGFLSTADNVVEWASSYRKLIYGSSDAADQMLRSTDLGPPTGQ